MRVSRIDRRMLQPADESAAGIVLADLKDQYSSVGAFAPPR